jgi:hypothetical protein
MVNVVEVFYHSCFSMQDADTDMDMNGNTSPGSQHNDRCRQMWAAATLLVLFLVHHGSLHYRQRPTFCCWPTTNIWSSLAMIETCW